MDLARREQAPAPPPETSSMPAPTASRRRAIGTRHRIGNRSRPLGRDLATFLAVALLALLVTAAGTVWMSERIARERVLDGAEQAAQRLARLSVAPLLAEVIQRIHSGVSVDTIFRKHNLTLG